MTRTDNIIDFRLFSKRRQARRNAEMLWMMAAAQAGFVTPAPATPARNSSEFRQA